MASSRSLFFFLLALLLLGVSLSSPNPSPAAAADPFITFSSFVAAYNKHYVSVEEHAHRETVFLANKALVAHLNAGERESSAGSSSPMRYALNAFADLSVEEFRATVLMPRRPSPRMPAAK